VQLRGQHDRAIGLLVVLEQRDQCSPDRGGSAVQRVQHLDSPVGSAHARLQPSRLVVGRVRAAGELTVLALTGQPCLDVVFLRGRATEIACGDVHDAVGHLEVADDLFLDAHEVLVLVAW
jgi:hypothetical protein